MCTNHAAGLLQNALVSHKEPGERLTSAGRVSSVGSLIMVEMLEAHPNSLVQSRDRRKQRLTTPRSMPPIPIPILKQPAFSAGNGLQHLYLLLEVPSSQVGTVLRRW